MSNHDIDSDADQRWLDDELRRLLDFGRGTVHPSGGAGWLDDDGRLRAEHPVELWITSRMVHTYALGALLGVEGAREIAEGALRGLQGNLVDREYGGWLASVDGDGDGRAVDATKSCYGHAFVLLAGSSAVVAGLSRADDLFAEAQQVMLSRFWDDEAGMCVDTWDRTWTDLDPYRGINANMHSVEAMLATADVTGDPAWSERAGRIAARLVEMSQQNGWRIPEHFDESWTPQPDFNRDRPADPFKPYGATVGHGLEWARLLLQVEETCGPGAGGGFVDAAVQLFDRAVADGWSADDSPGFVYTTDWDGRPVVRTRMHWVVAEAIATAAALWHRTGESKYAEWYRRCWVYAEQFLIDRTGGSWWHELDSDNHPSSQTWEGKPDLYHAVQVTLLPRLPVAPSIVTAVSRGLLTGP